MRVYLPLAILLTLAGCGQSQEAKRSSEDLQTYDVAEPSPPGIVAETARMEGPGIGPTAAPGIAFNYRYAFRLQGNRIAAVQEQHAQACEKLGLNRCRITGMRYRLVNDTDIEGMLAFKLDPSIARGFGKTGIEAVTRAEGMLIDSAISGEDAGAAITIANRNDAELNEDLTRVEAQLARPGLRADERARLQSEAAALRRSIRANSANRDEQEESLATTPMVFQYGSGDLVPGFDDRSSLGAAAKQAGDNFVSAIGVMLILIVSVLPWVALLVLIWWAYRLIAPRVRRFIPAAPPRE